MMRTVRMYISGTVQGVFFRAFVKECAEKLGLKGFVRNLDNGKVEVVAEGRDENIKQMIENCKKGPAHSDVKDVKVEESKHQGFKEFKILLV
jgi:acylphosphatase